MNLDRPIDTVMRAAGRPIFFGGGSYEGASSTRKALREWFPGIGSADSDSLPDLEDLRARSRDLIRNNGLVAGAKNTKLINVIGTGLRPFPQVDRELLGITEDDAQAWERQTERVWWCWAGGPGCDITNRFDFAGLQELAFGAVFESGDVFALRRHKRRKGDLLSLKLHLLEADRIENPDMRSDEDRLRGGIEIDEDGQPVRYYYRRGHPGEGMFGAGEWRSIRAFGPGSGERQVLHVMRPGRPDQRRGVPELAPVIEPLKQLGRYTDAELMAAVVSAMFTVFLKTEGPDDPLPGAPLNPNDSPATAEHLRLGYGAVVGLAEGEDISIANPARPNDKFDAFVLAIYRQVGVALGLPFEVLIKHFSSSYSASRAALLEAWRDFSTRRAWFVRQFCSPSYEWVVAEAVARGLIAAPGFFTSPIIRRAWLGVQWVGPAQSQIDPEREMKAAKLRIDEGISTRAQETAAMTGGDFDRNHVQRAREEQMRRADGVIPAAAPAAAAAPAGTVPSTPDTIDDE